MAWSKMQPVQVGDALPSVVELLKKRGQEAGVGPSSG
jgi:hypothetical protein